jgi:catechol 2,3-dioxygenase-like lactoylglutathione lyase family enzyme
LILSLPLKNRYPRGFSVYPAASQPAVFALSGYPRRSLDARSSSDNKPMITSIHTLIYSDDANATRAFLRDVLGWKYVAEDFDNDWLIFQSGPSEMGVHPTHSEWKGQTYDHPRHHSIALMCDDIDTTVDGLQTKGARFRGPIEQREYGRVIMLIVPGADDIQLYQPTHKVAYNL